MCVEGGGWGGGWAAEDFRGNHLVLGRKKVGSVITKNPKWRTPPEVRYSDANLPCAIAPTYCYEYRDENNHLQY